MNEAMWAVLSEWDMINIEVKGLVSSGLRGMSGELKESQTTEKWPTNQEFQRAWLFVTNWETFISYDCVKERKEYLRLNECGQKEMSSEFKES